MPANYESQVQRLIGVTELAARLDVKPSWVYDAVCYGRIPVVKVGKYNKFVFTDVLDALRQRPIRHMSQRS